MQRGLIVAFPYMYIAYLSYNLGGKALPKFEAGIVLYIGRSAHNIPRVQIKSVIYMVDRLQVIRVQKTWTPSN
jgi:hypothetical protein